MGSNINMQIAMSSFVGGRETVHTSINDILDLFKPGILIPRECIVISAPTGMGKSTLICQITIAWQHCHPLLAQFDYLFVLPLREIRNHTIPLSHIICKDLTILSDSAIGELERLFRTSSGKVLIMMDAFDTLSEEEMALDNVFTRMLAGGTGSDVPNATIIVNTRPHGLHHVMKYVHKRTIFKKIDLLGISQTDAISHFQKALKDRDISQPNSHKVAENIVTHIPKDIFCVPLLLQMMCYIWKWQVMSSGIQNNLWIFRKQTTIINALWGIMLGIDEERKGRCKSDTQDRIVNIYDSLMDDNLPAMTKRAIYAVSSMSYESVKKSKYKFDNVVMKNHSVCAMDCAILGFLAISGQPENATGEFIHPLFQDHAAGFHLAKNTAELKDICQNISDSQYGIGHCLTNLNQALLSAVGIDGSVLENIGKSQLKLPTVKYEYHNNMDLDLEYVARLFGECNDTRIADSFVPKSISGQIGDPVLFSPKLISSQKKYSESLGHHSIIVPLLKGVHHDYFIISGNGNITLRGVDNKRCITDPLLLRLLTQIHIQETQELYICQAEMLPLAKTRGFKVGISTISVCFHWKKLVSFGSLCI